MISQNYRMWRAEILDISTCRTCRDLHGKVYEIGKKLQPKPPIHPNCRCRIAEMPARYAGKGTKCEKSERILIRIFEHREDLFENRIAKIIVIGFFSMPENLQEYCTKLFEILDRLVQYELNFDYSVDS